MAEFSWTAQQAAAITTEKDTLLVANAGTGKTSTVIGKVLWQLGLDVGAPREDGVSIPSCADPCGLAEIAAITFTEKGAADLKTQLRSAIEHSARASELRWQIDRAYIGTIHGFCKRLLRENALRFGIEPNFGVLAEAECIDQQEKLIEDVVLRSLKRREKQTENLLLGGMKLRRVGTYDTGIVEHVRHALYDLRWRTASYDNWSANDALNHEYLRTLSPAFDDQDEVSLDQCSALFILAKRSLRRWHEHLEARNLRDFDSLILDLRSRLRSPEGAVALETIRQRYRLLIIDEFQDTDFAQRDIAFLIGHKVTRPQLLLVGDPKQSIYGFRSPDIAVWNDTQKAIAENGILLELSRNFRCAPPIVDFVNTTSSKSMGETEKALDGDLAECQIGYTPLEAGLPSSKCSGIEWLLTDGSNATKNSESGAAQVASRIRELAESGMVIDKESGSSRQCEFRDIAILYRASKNLDKYLAALSHHGIPYSVSGSGAEQLADRQEVIDLINALRLIRNPNDDLRALGYLRSPFVCLRDELIARFRLTSKMGDVSLLEQAEQFVNEPESWLDAPEHDNLVEIERESLRRGSEVIRNLHKLAYRAPVDDVLKLLLGQTGYRLHLLLNGPQEQALANIDLFLQFASDHRDLDIDDFLDVWAMRNSVPGAYPQAPLYSQVDNVVTVSTVHKAKGLEWPVVFFTTVERNVDPPRPSKLWSDSSLGPLLPPVLAAQGPRAQEIIRRRLLKDRAEESRLLYVATTRARDRLVLVGRRGVTNSYGKWLESGVELHGIEARTIAEASIPKEKGQRVSLEWLNSMDIKPGPGLADALQQPPYTFTRSASELMVKNKDPEQWERRYHDGVFDLNDFVSEGAKQLKPSGRQRGTMIHGVLEKIQASREIAVLLKETVSELGAPDLIEAMLLDADYGEALEEEIRLFVEDEKWKRYFEGEYYSELPFVHLLNSQDWRIGDLDLYRPGPEPLVIDFKTHESVTNQERAEAVATEYELQMRIYSDAAEAEARLFFTKARIEIAFPR